MKVRYYSLILIVVLTLSAFTMPALSDTPSRLNVSETNTANTTLFVLPASIRTEWCTVVLDNPRSSLNVRDANGRVIGKLYHGNSVYVDTYDGGFARVNRKNRRGALVTIGWVASEYLSC